MRNIGIFGGSFDPPHIGHLYLAETAYEKFSLSEIIIVPCGVSPYKDKIIETPVDCRIDMIELAMKDTQLHWWIDLFEARRDYVSYTIDTIRYIKGKYPTDNLFLICGPDANDTFHTWKDFEDITKYVTLAFSGKHFKCANLNVRSSMIRELIKEDINISRLVPKAVEKYILERYLYVEEI